VNPEVDYGPGCAREDCPCQTPGPVCSDWQGIEGETGPFCPRCGWAEHLHVGRRYPLRLPYEAPPKPLTGNYRSRNYKAKAAATRQLRQYVKLLAQAAYLHRIQGIQHVTVELVWAPGDNRRRDADNLWPMLKVAADGLARGRRDWVGLDLVPDDTPQYMEKKAPRIDPPPAEKGMLLHVTPHLEWPPYEQTERHAS
jgi:crossover junction endodeoxyribonuclease RusA